MPTIIEIDNLQYGHIFNNINIQIKNKNIMISGPNNCGKTTLIKILDKEISAKGTIKINGKDINDYKIEDYSKIVQSVIPGEIIFFENTLEEEITITEDTKYLIEELKIKRLLSKNTSTFTIKETILSQLLLALTNKPQILLLDSISNYFTKKEYENIMNILHKYQEENNLTIIQTSINLEDSLTTDYLYIINNGEIALEGKPLEVLMNDNIINKIGLNLPFMVDLSVKLKDYDLLDKIILDKDRMVEELWK